ncbi:MAG: 3-dehydroquinate synthase [Acidobacteria bacterium]|nr:3-dehydroquinate synthase [Acidobacteriota bacterium]
MDQPLTVSTSEGASYPVFVGAPPGTFFREVWESGWRTAAVIGDENTLGRFGDAVVRALEPLAARVLRLSFPPGEAHKTRETKAALEDALLDAGADRQACVVGLGGGIALDVAGFVAATYLRGVAHVGVATSLLAQVDASVGGKTGVNTRHGKNLVGAFHQPRAVLLATSWLASLPPAELRNGLAEAAKHAVIAGGDLFEALETLVQSGGPIPPDAVIRRCVEVKAGVVARDTREAGLRRVLNFGHTVGHALERATDYAVPHGEAVALGMAVESAVARRRCAFPPADRARLLRLLAGMGFPLRPPCPFEALAPHLAADKKTRDGVVHCALPAALGRMGGEDSGWAVPVTTPELEAAYETLTEGGKPCCA